MTKIKKQLHILGSINLDMIATGQTLPNAGETVLGKTFVTAPGGKGANQALAAARSGADVQLFGAVGSDDFAPLALAEMKKAHINLEGVITTPTSTGIAMVLINDIGENVIMVIPGANAKVDETMAQKCLEQMSKGDYLAMVQEIPPAAIKSALKMARDKGIISILNIAPAIPETKELAQLADIVIANETEAMHLFGKIVAEEKIADVSSKWACDNDKTLIITLGSRGVLGFSPTEQIKVEALKITPIDCVGAGDSFCGYLAAGLAAGQNLKTAMEQGATAGSLACLKPSAQYAIPNAIDVKNAMET